MAFPEKVPAACSRKPDFAEPRYIIMSRIGAEAQQMVMTSSVSCQNHKLQVGCHLGWVMVLLFSVCHLTPGNAQNGARKHRDCGNQGSQSEMNQCAAEEAKAADDALNKTYREFLMKLKSDKTATTRAIAAEKAWIAFRDAELASDWPAANSESANLLYGSVHPFCYYNEFAALTHNRIKVLQGRMKREEEGDVCSIQVVPSRSQRK